MEQVAALHRLYEKLMESEGVDLRKKNMKEKFEAAKTNLKKIKHLPGQRSEAGGLDATSVRIDAATPRPAPPPQGTWQGGLMAITLPPDWTSATDANGAVYYIHSRTGETRWTAPVA